MCITTRKTTLVFQSACLKHSKCSIMPLDNVLNMGMIPRLRKEYKMELSLQNNRVLSVFKKVDNPRRNKGFVTRDYQSECEVHRMKIDRVSADIKFRRTPVDAVDAYNLLIETLTDNIKQKRAVLEEMKTAECKEAFISNWQPNLKSLTVRINDD